ncbi:MAG: class I SAM-dependent methyltransferase [Pseudomonadota bacterium]
MSERTPDRAEPEVDFGYTKVAPAEKTRRVAGVFSRVAERYDVMNDLMSFGSHRLMKRMLIEMSGLRRGQRHLDLAGGTGDIAALASRAVGGSGEVVLADINAQMLEVGRDRMIEQGCDNVRCTRLNAEALPFADASFDCVTIGFGLRNVTDKARALEEMRRVLRPGCALLVLEFSKVRNPLARSAYRSFQALWPAAGKLLVGDAAPYRYLVESIEMHPGQEALALMLRDAGFDAVEHHDLAGGAAAIHRGVA